MSAEVVIEVKLPGIKPFKRGKVRDIFDLSDELLIVATDRISAFDSVLPNGIPLKGKILTALSEFWFNLTSDIIPNHLITTDVNNFPSPLSPFRNLLSQRSMLVKKAKPVEIECVVRGYLAGSAWEEYRETGSICGIRLPQGLKECEKLPFPIFTPATKSSTGHDLNITREEMAKRVGKEMMEKLESLSIKIFRRASEYLEPRGIILSDTKFEFGLQDSSLLLIDELLTPDSSRFWPQDDYEPGRPQKSFDKQFVRDYLLRSGWDKNPPPPSLPEEVVRKTMEKYLQAYRLITGREI